MFKLSSNITIKSQTGTIRFDYVTSVTVVTSVVNLTDTATVVFPRKLSWKDKSLRDLIRRGDEISISLGYDGNNNKVFEGYIRQVKSGTPLQIECEDQMYELKQISVPAKIYQKLKLSELFSGFCSIPYEIADIDLGKFRIEKETTFARVIDAIRSDYGMSFFIREGKVYGVLPTTLISKSGGWKHHYFETGTERANANFDKIEYILADDVKLIVKAFNILKDNTKIEVQSPDEKAGEGEVRTFWCESAESKKALQSFADETLKSMKIDQMKGTFTALGEPFVQKGDAVKLKDPKNPDWQDHEFLVKGVTYEFNAGGKGFAQTIELGYQVK